jgi:hypothetical protein
MAFYFALTTKLDLSLTHIHMHTRTHTHTVSLCVLLLEGPSCCVRPPSRACAPPIVHCLTVCVWGHAPLSMHAGFCCCVRAHVSLCRPCLLMSISVHACAYLALSVCLSLSVSVCLSVSLSSLFLGMPRLSFASACWRSAVTAAPTCALP